MSLVADIRQAVQNLAPGEEIRVTSDLLSEAAPPPSIARFLPSIPDRVLESITGSAFEFGYQEMGYQEGVVFYRLRRPTFGNKRSHVSADRRHLYYKDGDVFILRSRIASAEK